MNYSLLFRTVKHLKLIQMLYQVRNRLIRPSLVQLKAPNVSMCRLSAEPVPKCRCVEGSTFRFLNLEHEFAGWSFTDNGMLWAYNQNYFDWINQDGITAEEGCNWIDLFIKELSENKVGLDPYPIALRCINWVKFLCRYPECATKERLDSLYSQIRLLEKKLEYHLLGNHLLEDAYALYIVGSYFDDKKLLKRVRQLLNEQLNEQILSDGAHYEQSPMYHCILLDRLLDCVNTAFATDDVEFSRKLRHHAVMMLGHLASIVWNDNSIPLLNDSALEIAPMPKQIFDYATRLGIEWNAIPLKDSGYRKLQSSRFEAVVDVGNITADYQPGHTHADSLNYELRVDGKPFVIDTGISTYNKTERRQLERSTIAHNCVSVEGKNSSEVWGGFRVGRRCHTKVTEESEGVIVATHDGYDKSCRRSFVVTDESFIVIDKYDGIGVSYIHLAEGADENRIKVDGALKVEVLPWKYSMEYNRFIDGKMIAITFIGDCKYYIQ